VIYTHLIHLIHLIYTLRTPYTSHIHLIQLIYTLYAPYTHYKAISEFDMDYAKANIEKYGEDYTKMQMDIKTNSRQYTAKKIEKLCLKYIAEINSMDE
jgi:hypothetical protein